MRDGFLAAGWEAEKGPFFQLEIETESKPPTKPVSAWLSAGEAELVACVGRWCPGGESYCAERQRQRERERERSQEETSWPGGGVGPSAKWTLLEPN